MKKAVHIGYLVSLLTIIVSFTLFSMLLLAKMLGAKYSYAVACLPAFLGILASGVCLICKVLIECFYGRN